MSREHEAFEAKGVELIIIGNGALNFIEGFRDRSGFTGPIYTDPELKSYRAPELRRNLGATFSLRVVKRAVSAYRKGNRQVSTQGDTLQQGGVFVINIEGDLVYAYRSEFAGDHPKVADILRSS